MQHKSDTPLLPVSPLLGWFFTVRGLQNRLKWMVIYKWPHKGRKDVPNIHPLLQPLMCYCVCQTLRTWECGPGGAVYLPLLSLGGNWVGTSRIAPNPTTRNILIVPENVAHSWRVSSPTCGNQRLSSSEQRTGVDGYSGVPAPEHFRACARPV